MDFCGEKKHSQRLRSFSILLEDNAAAPGGGASVKDRDGFVENVIAKSRKRHHPAHFWPSYLLLRIRRPRFLSYFLLASSCI